ncbi:MAG: succinylglutamate desuccinylase/aspartoacylase family protein [Anaerolineae bacterium]
MNHHKRLWRVDPDEWLPIDELGDFAERAIGCQRRHLMVRQLRDGSFLTVPAAVISDGRDGPWLVLVSGQHGNEWNGPWILHRLTHSLNPEQVSGTIVILPIANPMAFNEGRRASLVDSIDLNRTYGGRPPRKPTEHLGAILWDSVFSRADYLIDLHSGGPGEYLPFASAVNGKELALARTLNLPYIHTPQRTKSGFLVDTCQQIGIRAIMVEVGGGHSLDTQYHPAVLDGLANFMRAVGILEGEPVPGPEPYVFGSKAIVSAPCAGFFQPGVELGQHVQEGDPLGYVTALLSEVRVEILSPRAGTVLYLRKEPVIGEQDSLAHIV